MFRALVLLIRMRILSEVKKFPGIYQYIKKRRTAISGASAYNIRQLSDAMHVASVWLPFRSHCLVYSAATVCFLRKNGISAQLVLGIRQRPFESHAWVEHDGIIITDPAQCHDFIVVDRI